MKNGFTTSILTLTFASLVALPTAPLQSASAAEDSDGGSLTDSAKSIGHSAKDAAENAGSVMKDSAESAGSKVKDSTKSAAGYVADTAKDARARLGGKDSLFVREIAIGGLSELKSAELAKTKSSSADVKSFADRMVEDHTKANEELEQLAKEKGIAVPTAIDNTHQAKLDELSKLSGPAFDKAYVKQQRMGHEKMLRLLEDEAKNGKDADLKGFAAKAKSVVSEHHSMIEKLGKAGAHSAAAS